MIRINENYLKLQSSYLFSEINKRVNDFLKVNPGRQIIKLGIGDVTLPLPEVCIKAFHKAVKEMADVRTFHGYGPDQGYEFLREKIARYDYEERGVDISPDEIFISDGAKSDGGNIQELFATDILVAIPDPVYPVYQDTNVMAGRTGSWQDDNYQGLFYLECTEANSYIPQPPALKVDLIYLCFPNNPTGATIDKEQLAQWVAYARRYKALIIYDAAYVAFIRDEKLPQSIFEIDGAKEIAVEIRSYSKTAGFTGTRCAYTVIPKQCTGFTQTGAAVPLHQLWLRRQTTKLNGVSYPVQRAAEAIYSTQGKKQVKALSDYYLENAGHIRKKFSDMGYHCTGGDNSPYIWINTGMPSWDFFNLLLDKAGVICTPGSGFGKCGQGYVRISAFNSHENVARALENISAVLPKKKV